MKIDGGVLTLHQSDIGHFMTCPEQFRAANGITPGGLIVRENATERVETDAATIGTVIHALIEHELRGDHFDSLDEMHGWVANHYMETITGYFENEVIYRTESYGDDPTKAVNALRMLTESWFGSNERSYWLQREPNSFKIEEFFDVPFLLGRDSDVVTDIRLAGTADIFDLGQNRVLDWKSAGREYQRWEKQRWAHQPTVYTFAAAYLGYLKPDEDNNYRFDYRVFIRKNNMKEPQELTVYRSIGQWGWLTMIVENIARMIESNATMWPLRDDHALCSPKWCPVWENCKGSFVTEEWT